MLNKEILKEYVVRKCDRLAYIMSHKEYAFSLLKKIMESQISLQDDLEDDEDSESDKDRLVDYIKLYPEAYNELTTLLAHQELDIASIIIEEMKNHQEVSELSRRYFAKLYPGVCARADTHDLSLDGHEIRNLEQVEANTQALLKNPRISVIFEGQVSRNGLLARWDVLIKQKNGYILFEVKGSNSVYTKVDDQDKIIPNRIKKPFLYDLAFQYEVYKQAGLNILETNFLFLNKEFISHKDSLTYPLDNQDVLSLFVQGREVFDSTKKDKQLIAIKDYIEQLLYVTKTDEPVHTYIQQLKNIEAQKDLPEVKLMYACRKSGGCILKSDCYPNLATQENHIFKLTCNNRIGGNYVVCKNLIDEMGIEQIAAIPKDVIKEKYPDSKNGKRLAARMQIDYAQGSLEHPTMWDYEGIKSLLVQDYSVFPLVFFDFETFSYPIPIVANARPWERVCCQYSMHVVEANYNLAHHDFMQGKGGGITHYEFIGNPQLDQIENPELKLITTLKDQFTRSHIDVEKGLFTLVVYNKNFEKGELKRMAKKYPEHQVFLDKLNERVVDLLDFFIQGYWYQQDFHGRVSLKVTQPNILKNPVVVDLYKDFPYALKETLDYKKGIIQNGGVALDVYQSLLRKVLLHRDVDEHHDLLISALLSYCKIDSWGTVVLYDIIKRVSIINTR